MESTSLVADGRKLRINPADANVGDFPEWKNMKPEKAEQKIKDIKRGAEVQSKNEPFPANRKLQDGVWLGLFLVTVGGVLGYGFVCFPALLDRINDETKKFTPAINANDLFADKKLVDPTAGLLCSLCATAGCASLIASMSFIFLARRAAKCVVWTSLLFGPVFYITLGCALISTMEQIFIIIGGVFVLIGGLSLTCVYCCWRRFVPFMVSVTKVVAEVIERHPCMIGVGVIGTVLALGWTVGSAVSFAAIFAKHLDFNQDLDNPYVKYTIVFVTALLFSWGAGVANNICHVTYCGVFGRWYYGSGGLSSASADDENTLTPSFMVAITTSLGSICFGSLLVAIVRAMEAMARQMERDAQKGDNPVLMVVACLITCIISCIGDILEYFNDWAYVQCAIRGVSFMDAASITYSMMTCANMKYVLSDLLLNSVVSMGSFIVAAVSAGSAALVGYFIAGSVAAIWGAGLGFLIGIMSGAAALGIINSGVKTILVCWADDPKPLEELHEDISNEFEDRLRTNFTAAMSKR